MVQAQQEKIRAILSVVILLFFLSSFLVMEWSKGWVSVIAYNKAIWALMLVHWYRVHMYYTYTQIQYKAIWALMQEHWYRVCTTHTPKYNTRLYGFLCWTQRWLSIFKHPQILDYILCQNTTCWTFTPYNIHISSAGLNNGYVYRYHTFKII